MTGTVSAARAGCRAPASRAAMMMARARARARAPTSPDRTTEAALWSRQCSY